MLKSGLIEDGRIDHPAISARMVFLRDGPALVNVVNARHDLSMRLAIPAAPAQGFGHHILRARPSGLGDEIVELAAASPFQ